MARADSDSGLHKSAVAWSDPGWLDEVAAWIGSRVELAGPIERKKKRKWSVVLRAPTVEGDLWLKEVGPMLAFEPALTAALASHAPRFVPDVVAAEGSRLLMRDAGEQLIGRDRAVDATSPLWEEIAARYAEFQLQLVPVAGELPAPDRRSETLIRDLGPRVEPLVSALGTAIPMTIVHLDVSHKNVRFRAGSPVLLDWAAGVVAHPFFGLGKTVRTLVHFGAAPAGPEVLASRMRISSRGPCSPRRESCAGSSPLRTRCGSSAARPRRRQSSRRRRPRLVSGTSRKSRAGCSASRHAASPPTHRATVDSKAPGIARLAGRGAAPGPNSRDVAATARAVSLGVPARKGVSITEQQPAKGLYYKESSSGRSFQSGAKR